VKFCKEKKIRNGIFNEKFERKTVLTKIIHNQKGKKKVLTFYKYICIKIMNNEGNFMSIFK